MAEDHSLTVVARCQRAMAEGARQAKAPASGVCTFVGSAAEVSPSLVRDANHNMAMTVSTSEVGRLIQRSTGKRITCCCSRVSDPQTERGSGLTSRLLSVYQRRT